MTNPITAIEQITYLIFLQRLEDLDKQHQAQGKPSIYEPDHTTCRWSHITSLKDTREVYEVLTKTVFPWLRVLGRTIRDRWSNGEEAGVEVAEYLEDAYFQLPREKTGTLRQALEAVDQLFTLAGKNSAHSDLMGDIFEYLLDELRTSGKNGQFRTPRHIIRFMIELLDPAPNARIVDPAAGTGGYLTNTLLYHRMKATPREQLRLEWDGTPHRLVEIDRSFDQRLLTGYDNDRTMVRIGWMNLILHGLTNPRFVQKDALGSALNDNEIGIYDYALANPPYSGTVDKTDLHPDHFPRKSPRSEEPITERSELLFIWLMLALLKPGGMMAVIVPEGTLFGTAGAHRELRRQLLYDHEVEGVISLPQGVFQPYTNVKTSILIVRKHDTTNERSNEPCTQNVWFYEVESDGYTLGANRTPQPKVPNDLWDALEKWKIRNDAEALKREATTYWQPQVFRERWRLVDAMLARLFPNVQELQEHLDETLAIQELFSGLFPVPPQYSDPEDELKSAESSAINSRIADLEKLLLKIIAKQPFARKPLFTPAAMTSEQLNHAVGRLQTDLLSRSAQTLERREGIGSFAEEHGRAVLEQAIDRLREQVTSPNEILNRPWQEIVPTQAWMVAQRNFSITDQEIESLLKPFARLDGFDIYRRSIDVTGHPNGITEPKCWVVPVRVWKRHPDWVSEDGKIQCSHDGHGRVRPEYMAEARDPKTGRLRPEYLDPECIEANDLNLSAGRYKPHTELALSPDTVTPTELINELLKMERGILASLEELLKMVEGHV